MPAKKNEPVQDKVRDIEYFKRMNDTKLKEHATKMKLKIRKGMTRPQVAEMLWDAQYSHCPGCGVRFSQWYQDNWDIGRVSCPECGAQSPAGKEPHCPQCLTKFSAWYEENYKSGKIACPSCGSKINK